MTQPPTPWLPPEVVERRATQAPFDQALVAWRADWLPNLPLRIGTWTLQKSEPRLGGEGDAWRVPHACVAVSCALRAKMRLASAALGLDLEAAKPNERDRAVLSGFCDRLLADLAERFDGVLGEAADAPATRSAGAPFRTAPEVLATVEGDDGVLVRIALPAQALVALYRRSLPGPPAAAKALDDRLKALTSSTVRLEATLGEATITLPELRAMAPGDVLRLNRKLTDPGSLSLAGGGFVAHASLTHSDGRLALRLRQASATGTK